MFFSKLLGVRPGNAPTLVLEGVALVALGGRLAGEGEGIMLLWVRPSLGEETYALPFICVTHAGDI